VTESPGRRAPVAECEISLPNSSEKPEGEAALPGGGLLFRPAAPRRYRSRPWSRSSASPRSGRHRQPARRPASYREALAVREFRGLWSAQALSAAGDQIGQVAIAVLVYTRTGSAFLTALAYALTYLPPIAGGPLLSGLADLLPRHRVMIALDLIRAGLVAIMALPGMPFAGLCALLFGTVLLNPPFSTARSALLPDVLPPDKFVTGSAIGGITFQISQVAGFVAGSGAVAVLGPDRALVLDALSFLLSATIVARSVKSRPAPPRGITEAPSLLAVARDGATLVFGNPVLRTLVFFGWLAGFSVVPEGLAAPYARALGGGPLTVGLLMAAMPAGTVVGLFTVGHLARPSDRLRPMGWLAMLSCAPLVVSLTHPPFWLVLVLWGIAGAGGAYQLAAAAAFALALSAHDRARAFGIAQTGLLAAQGFGILADGAIAQRIGPQAAVALAGLLGLILAAALASDWTRQHGEMIRALSRQHIAASSPAPPAQTPPAQAAPAQAAPAQAAVPRAAVPRAAMARPRSAGGRSGHRRGR
jgi:MFS family permease